MTEYSDLKSLAEVATPGPWKAVDYRTYDGKASHWYLDTSAASADMADGQDGTVDPNHWDFARGERDMKFIAAANPAAVLTLIAENERLLGKLSSTMGVGGGNGSLFVHGDYDSIRAAQAIVLERDQLKADVERLAKNSEEWEQAAMHWMHRSDHLRDKVTTIRNAFRPLLAHWDDLKPGDSIRVDAAREAMSKEPGHD